MSKRIIPRRKPRDGTYSSDSSDTDSFDTSSMTDSEITSSTDSGPRKVPVKRVHKSPEKYEIPRSPIRKQDNSPMKKQDNFPDPDTDTERKVNDILKKLDYNDLSSVQTMLDLTLKKLDSREKDLVYYQKKCMAYEKVIETLQNELKTFKNPEKK